MRRTSSEDEAHTGICNEAEPKVQHSVQLKMRLGITVCGKAETHTVKVCNKAESEIQQKCTMKNRT